MAKDEKNKSNSGDVILFVFFVVLLVMLSPGMMMMSVIRDISNSVLDTGQMWTFSSIICIIYISLLWIKLKQFYKIAYIYFFTCIFVCALYLIAYFGLKFAFPLNHWHYFFPQS